MSPRGVTVASHRYLSSSETRLMLAKEDENSTYLNQLDARNLLVVSVSQMSEEQLLHDP
jgi:hypothetical protein